MRVLQTTTAAKPKVCVFLLQLGSPKDAAEVQPFLRHVLQDTLPLYKPLRRLTASLLANFHKAAVAGMLGQIKTDTPLRLHGEAQRAALQEHLCGLGYAARVLVADRYAPPLVADALLEARASCADAQWVALPAYPQYAFSTTQQSIQALLKRLSPSERQRLHVVDAYPEHPLFLQAMAQCVQETLDKLSPEARREAHLVFAARGMPLKSANAGDPYTRQIEQTVTGILARLDQPPRHTLAFQPPGAYLPSPVPRARTLEPLLTDALQRLGAAGQKTVVVVPLSFTSEQFETLHGLDVVMRSVALASGIEAYCRVPTVATRPAFIAALGDLVQRQVGPVDDAADENDDAARTCAPIEQSVHA